MPTRPPIPWQGKTSSVSSRDVFDFQCTTTLLMMAAKVPMNKLAGIVTKPAAGVMATRPTTAPIQNPRADGFFPRTASKRIQQRPAAAEAVFVVAKAEAASGVAPIALPPLKPNQPNQRRPVPNSTKGMFAGAIAVFLSFLLRRYMDAASAANPADICTTVPPAKSRTPSCARNPSGCHVQCASGAYIKSEKRTMNMIYDLN